MKSQLTKLCTEICSKL